MDCRNLESESKRGLFTDLPVKDTPGVVAVRCFRAGKNSLVGSMYGDRPDPAPLPHPDLKIDLRAGLIEGKINEKKTK